MTYQLEVKKAGIEDADAITALAKRTFSETYTEILGNAIMQQLVQERFVAENFAKEFNVAGTSFFIGYVNGKAVAFAKLKNGRDAKKGPVGRATEVEQIYVLKEYQGVKIGKQLMDSCIEFAKSSKYALLWLQVWQKNMKAVSFYQKAGFVIYDTTDFRYTGEIEQYDFLMKLDLYY